MKEESIIIFLLKNMHIQYQLQPMDMNLSKKKASFKTKLNSGQEQQHISQFYT